MTLLRELEITGYTSICRQKIELGLLNVLIGANGAGKSNLLSFFRLLESTGKERLQLHVAKAGGANCLLHYGAKITPEMGAKLVFQRDAARTEYHMRLAHAAGDVLTYAEESICSYAEGHAQDAVKYDLGSGHNETGLLRSRVEIEGRELGPPLWGSLPFFWHVFHFHDTSSTAKIRQHGDLNDNRQLSEDGGNLAAFLYKLLKTQPAYYARIRGTIQQIVPFFDDFVLARSPLNQNSILLRWKERNADLEFGPHQLSDGTLRAMALVALLLQPEQDLPSAIVIDEPELGQHPYAIEVLASLLRHAAAHCQVILATQSATLVDHFAPEDVMVVERRGRESTFSRLDPEALEDWLKDYSLGELWMKNVLGGGPSR